jgi:hypothetical protein
MRRRLAFGTAIAYRLFMLRVMRSLSLFVLLTLPVGASAQSDAALIAGASQCTQYFPQQEREKGIPIHLLAAIASAESGRWSKSLEMPLPWPWTINVEGKGYYFDTKAEAIAQTEAYLKQGKRSIDVGCMQVNLKHHAGAFRNLNEAFEPQKNVTYAAEFLRNNYEDLGDWVKATGAYHSRTPHLGSRYLKRIETTWNRIVSKVQQAQARQGITPHSGARVVNARNQMQPLHAYESPAVARLTPQNVIESTRNVKVIEVSNAQPRRESVLAITPTSQRSVGQQMATPQRQAHDALLVQGATQNIASSAAPAIDNSATPAHTGRQPNFVFAN